MMMGFKLPRKAALIVSAAVLLSGCGSISLVKPTPAADIYDIEQSPVAANDLSPVEWRLVVEEPLADRSINTDRILIMTGPHVVQYVSAARWSDRVPDLVHSHLVSAFEDTGLITSVGREVTGLRRDYELKGEVRDFQVEDYKGDPRVKVSVSFKLVAYPSAEVSDSRVFTSVQEIDSVRMGKVVNGFDAALGEVISDAVLWTLEAGNAGKGIETDRGSPKRIDPIEQDLRKVSDGASEEEVDLSGVGGEEGIE